MNYKIILVQLRRDFAGQWNKAKQLEKDVLDKEKILRAWQQKEDASNKYHRFVASCLYLNINLL